MSLAPKFKAATGISAAMTLSKHPAMSGTNNHGTFVALSAVPVIGSSSRLQNFVIEGQRKTFSFCHPSANDSRLKLSPALPLDTSTQAIALRNLARP